LAKETKETVVEQVQPQEPVYSRDELIAAAVSFGVKPEVVAGALRLAGKDSMTRAEAEKAIKAFLERKV
jgi:hypothetical protein